MNNSKKNYNMLIVLMLAVILFCNCKNVQAQVLEDPAYGYSFEHPYDWKAKFFPNSKNLIRGEINKDNNTGAQIRIYPLRESFRNFVDGYVDDFMQQMQKHWGGEMVIIEREFTIVAGYECFFISFDFTRRDNKRWFFKQYLWPKGSEVLVLQSGTQFELRALNEPTIDWIADTLKFNR